MDGRTDASAPASGTLRVSYIEKGAIFDKQFLRESQALELHVGS